VDEHRDPEGARVSDSFGRYHYHAARVEAREAADLVAKAVERLQAAHALFALSESTGERAVAADRDEAAAIAADLNALSTRAFQISRM
jgi:hypothetical protein